MSEIIDLSELDNIEDEWGGIDNGIMRIVKALSALGIKTDGSCEGHVDHASPVPFVSVFQLDSGNNLLQEETSSEYNKVIKLINEFYNGRIVDTEYRIIGEEPAFIHNGKTLWDKWREEIKERTLARRSGIVIERPVLSQEEIEMRKKTIPKLQEEFNSFSEFLENKIS